MYDSFCISVSDSNPLGTLEDRRHNSATSTQRALANNTALAGKLNVGPHHELGIRIVYTGKDGREFIFYIAGAGRVSIFERKSKATVEDTFGPSTVTPGDLDYVIERSFPAPSAAPSAVPVVAEAQAE